MRKSRNGRKASACAYVALCAMTAPAWAQQTQGGMVPCETTVMRMDEDGNVVAERVQVVGSDGRQILANTTPPTPPAPGDDTPPENPHFWDPPDDLMECLAGMGSRISIGFPEVPDLGGLADYLCNISRRYTGDILRRTPVGDTTRIEVPGNIYEGLPGDFPTRREPDVNIPVGPDELSRDEWCAQFPGACSTNETPRP